MPRQSGGRRGSIRGRAADPAAFAPRRERCRDEGRAHPAPEKAPPVILVDDASSDPDDLGQVVEMAVARMKDEIVLKDEGGDPDVVRRNRGPLVT